LAAGAHYAIAREWRTQAQGVGLPYAEGYPSGELKHGPNALVSKDAPLIMIATADANDPDSILRYSKVLQLMKEMREQGARIVALATEGDNEVPRYSDSCLFIPASDDLLSTILRSCLFNCSPTRWQLAAASTSTGQEPGQGRHRGVDRNRNLSLLNASFKNFLLTQRY